MINKLSDFVQVLEENNELLRIKEKVSQDLEISEFYLREIAKGEKGKALLFENVEGSDIPVLINSMGSFKRLKLAFNGRSLDELSADLRSFLDLKPPQNFSDKISTLKQLSKVRNFLPKTVKQAPCQELVLTGDEIDLNRIPILKTWPEDAGRFITLPLVFSKSIDGNSRNCGMYRMQVYDGKTTGMHWQIHHDASNFYSQYRKAKKRMEVAVAIGAEPALVFASIAPLPPTVFEMLIAGFIRNKPVEMVKCKTVDMEVPAQAEIILEGYVEADELREEGPFGDHTGYYTLEEMYPVFHLTAITMRKNPIYMTTVVGRSPQEDCYFGGKATERIFLPLFQAISHEVKDMLLPWDSCFHNCNIISMSKQFPLHARRLMSQVWGQGQASTCKAIVTVDEDVALSDDEKMLDYTLNHIDLKQDIFITEGIVDALDHSSYQWAYGGKIGIDATKAIEGEVNFSKTLEKRSKVLPENFDFSEIKKLSDSILEYRVYGEGLINTVLLIKFSKKNQASVSALVEKIFAHNYSNYIDIFLFIDEQNDLNDGHKVMWRLFNNTDWNRDLYFNQSKSKIIIDSTYKTQADDFMRRWPGDLLMDEKTIASVDQKLERIDK